MAQAPELDAAHMACRLDNVDAAAVESIGMLAPLRERVHYYLPRAISDELRPFSNPVIVIPRRIPDPLGYCSTE